jgi:hypothetical protein
VHKLIGRHNFSMLYLIGAENLAKSATRGADYVGLQPLE